MRGIPGTSIHETNEPYAAFVFVPFVFFVPFVVKKKN